MTDELTWQEKRDAGIKASKLKKQEREKSSRIDDLESEVESLRQEVMALKKAHNNLLTLLEKGSNSQLGRTSTTYTSFYVGEF